MKDVTKQLLAFTFVDATIPMVFLPIGIYYSIITNSFNPSIIGGFIYIICRVSYALRLKDKWYMFEEE
jgi:hypothetical protein